MAEREYLPGHPAPKHVRELRRHLAGFGIRPQPKLWRLTWQWASAIRNSYAHARWPNPADMGVMYFALMFAEKRSLYGMKLPPRAGDRCPAAVVEALGGDLAAVFTVQEYPREPYLGPCPEERPLAELMADLDAKAEARKPAAVAQARPGELRQNTLLDAVFGDE